jgi:hypothetical protein
MAPEWRGTTVQVCGLWPFAVGTGTPMVGVPIGRNIMSGATLCCDPISWFQRANLISNPSMFVLGKPGLGKSTITRRMATGLSGFGVQPFILGDLKPDYVDLVEALGGQVITLGRGRGHINVLDPGQSGEVIDPTRATILSILTLVALTAAAVYVGYGRLNANIGKGERIVHHVDQPAGGGPGGDLRLACPCGVYIAPRALKRGQVCPTILHLC